MGRRNKQSPADDVMDLAALLPWWVGVVLALVSYLVLHRLAVAPTAASLQPGQIGDLVARTMVAGFASGGQFLLPLLFLFGALISFLRRRKRQSLVASVTQSKAAGALNDMSWRDFELLVGEAFRLQGYGVIEQGGAQADGGVDIVLRKRMETFLVQCKQWKSYTVGVAVVRELYGVMAARGAAGGFVVTSGSFTTDASAFAHGRNVTLIDGPKLFGLIQQAKAARSTAGSAPAMQPAVRPPLAQTVSLQEATASRQQVAAPPLCPACGAQMARRTAKKGANAGALFWGCSTYPACRGTR